MTPEMKSDHNTKMSESVVTFISRVITQRIKAPSQPHTVLQFISFPLDVHTLQANKRPLMDMADGRNEFMAELCQLMQLLI